MSPTWRTGVIVFMLACCSPATAADVVVVVSSKSAPLKLTNAQVADIFLGRAVRFPDGSRAVPVEPDEADARDAFYSAFMGRSAAQVKAHWSKIIFTGRGQPPRQMPDADAARELVSLTPGAITYLPASMVNASVHVVASASAPSGGSD